MNPQHTPQQFRRASSKTRTAVRWLVVVSVVAACAAAWLTAGPGNGAQPTLSSDVLRLPTVVIVGKREAAPVDAASSSVPSVATVPTASKAD